MSLSKGTMHFRTWPNCAKCSLSSLEAAVQGIFLTKATGRPTLVRRATAPLTAEAAIFRLRDVRDLFRDPGRTYRIRSTGICFQVRGGRAARWGRCRRPWVQWRRWRRSRGRMPFGSFSASTDRAAPGPQTWERLSTSRRPTQPAARAPRPTRYGDKSGARLPVASPGLLEGLQFNFTSFASRLTVIERSPPLHGLALNCHDGGEDSAARFSTRPFPAAASVKKCLGIGVHSFN